jgi:hypothetical protein
MSREVDTYRAGARASEIVGLTEVQDAILQRVINGEGIATICRDASMPSKAIVFRWLAANEAFRLAYKVAAELRGEHIFEEALEIANQEPPRIIVQTGEDITESRVDAGAVQHAKLKIDTLKWAASKLNPKRYGDKIDVTTGGDKLSREYNDVEVSTRLASMAASILGRARSGDGDD